MKKPPMGQAQYELFPTHTIKKHANRIQIKQKIANSSLECGSHMITCAPQNSLIILSMRIFLAPMEGVVDQHMRYMLTHIGGIDMCVTEFIRVNDHALNDKVFYKYCPELNPALIQQCPTLTPTKIQLLGSNAELLAINAKRAANLGAIGIDLNFGCPAKTVNKSRGGACLLNETQTLFDIVKAVRLAVPKQIPVSAKIRLGYEERNSYMENSQAIQEAGADELCVHARSKSDGYKPPAYWECIGEINSVLSIPVIANGDIWNLDDFNRCKAVSGSTDFMLGRGLLSQPDLALKIKAHCKGEDLQPLSWPQITEKLLEFFLLSCKTYPPKHMGNRLKQWLFYLSNHYTEAQELFQIIKSSRDIAFLTKARRHKSYM